MSHELSKDAAGGHVAPLGLYFAIFVALLVLTGVTVWVATVELGPLNTPVAMAIAVTKALLVVLYFMHLRYSPRLTALAVGAGVLWFAIMVAFTLSDFFTRGVVSGLPR